jgi:hypothetical protein
LNKFHQSILPAAATPCPLAPARLLEIQDSGLAGHDASGVSAGQRDENPEFPTGVGRQGGGRGRQRVDGRGEQGGAPRGVLVGVLGAGVRAAVDVIPIRLHGVG